MSMPEFKHLMLQIHSTCLYDMDLFLNLDLLRVQFIIRVKAELHHTCTGIRSTLIVGMSEKLMCES